MSKSTIWSAEKTGSQDLVSLILQTAVRANASDIHIDPHDTYFQVRLRVDGELSSWRRLPSHQLPGVVSRIKVLANMDITEHRLPQDGRFSVTGADGDRRDFRVSTSPMLHGEKLVIRLLHKHLFRLEFDFLGYSERNLAAIKGLLKQPYGFLLHCGPTGSGKTTSLYTAINYLNDNTRNIQTIEDPVEGRLPGVNQAQVNPDIDLTFASLLRAYLRQDCDVILVGEIRDDETAHLAVQAALTGHLILGTMHANTASSAVTLLIEMGIAPFFVGSALTGVVNQRLVRRLCLHCRQPFLPSRRVTHRFRLQPGTELYRTGGCDECGGTGFRGRLSIQEVLVVDSQIREAIHAETPEFELQQLAIHRGMVNLLTDGLGKAMAGLTTVDEVTLVVQGVGMSADEMVGNESKAPQSVSPREPQLSPAERFKHRFHEPT